MVGTRIVGTPEKPSSAPAEAAEGSIRAVSELVIGSRIVYPNQGVCRVGEIQAKEIAGQKLEFVSMTREEDGALILVPVNKVPSIGLRHVADSGEIGDVFDLLASSFDDPELDWKVRHRMHGDLMAAGGVLGVAEVLKALQGLANLRPLPQKERERYDAARHLLVHEIAVALGVPEATAEDFIDLALIPPPGTVRPAAKPRRLATLPPKLAQRPARAIARGADEEELEELGLFGEEELEPLGLEGEEEEAAEGEGEGEGEAAEGEEAAAEEAEEKPKAKAAKPRKPKAPAKPRKTKKAAGTEGEAGEAAAPEGAEVEPAAAAPAEAAPEEEAAPAAPKKKRAPARKAAGTEAKTTAKKPPAAAKKAAAKAPAEKAPEKKDATGEKPPAKSAAKKKK
jgi:CarD family transcriptional regulator